jgi:hypothetical protein
MWKITVVRDAGKQPATTAQFEVKKYVLPKFQVGLIAPTSVVIDQVDFNVTACAR